MKKRILSLLLVLLMVLSLVPTAALAEETAIIDSGYCGGEGDGTNLTWTLYENGTLEISGKGEMASWDMSTYSYNYSLDGGGLCASNAPWGYQNEVFTNVRIKKLVIEDGVSSIGTIAFLGCRNLTSVMIPSSVTSIGDRAFEACTGLTSITLPDNLTSIGVFTFADCTSLSSVVISDSVTNIDYFAFENCTSLTSIMIPDSVTSVEPRAFYGCTSLTSINAADANPVYSSLNGVLFNKDKTRLIRYPEGKTEASYTIPDSVWQIDYCAFFGCENLKSVILPNSVASIRWWAFRGCTGIASITISNSVQGIAEDAFSGCTGLTSINVTDANMVYSSDNGVLFNKDKTELILYPEGKTEASYTIPNSVESIGRIAFCNCASLTSVNIPGSVTSIGTGAFSLCTNLKSIKVPASVTSINIGAFTENTGLTSIIVADANTVYSSVDGVLFNKDKTEIVKYPEGKKGAPYTIPNSVTRIGDGAFELCVSLTSLEMPDSVTSIDVHAFSNCYSLTDVYYTGSEERWNAIEIADCNDYILNATIHYNYHEHVTELCNAVAPTCTEAGYTGDEVCSICGETIKEGEVIPATGHHFKGNTCPDCGETRSTADTIRAWFQESFNNMKNFFDKIFGRV